MISIFNRVSISGLGLICAGALLSGCASAQKNMQPVSDQQKGEFLKGLSVVEQPALEPEWADYVKGSYPSWRRHYWVDRGQWGNRGYILGGASVTAEPVVAEITPQPIATGTSVPNLPPAIVEQEQPKIDTAEKPTKYIVKKGDSLWKIAGKVYHNPLKWPRIYRANKDKIKHPNKIYPNQVLTIPWE